MNPFYYIYYTVEKETAFIGGTYEEGEECTGRKTITVYQIANNTPRKRVDIITNKEDSREAIQDWLDDNGYGDIDYIFKQL